jgi:hypothetical protein
MRGVSGSAWSNIRGGGEACQMLYVRLDTAMAGHIFVLTHLTLLYVTVQFPKGILCRWNKHIKSLNSKENKKLIDK